jgi:tRNA uridine 5-carbamoylmethylation protein Kti12
VGFPASGKSTFARKFKEIIEKKFEDVRVKIIDPDLIRESITRGEFNHKKEKLVRKKKKKLIKKALSNGNIVISDDLNYYSSMRHELMEIAENMKRGFFIVHIATPLEECLKWNEERGKKIPNEVIHNVSNKFDDFNRYGWDNPIDVVDPSKISNLSDKIEDIINTISIKMNKDVLYMKTTVDSRKHSNPNNERLEKISRKYVGSLLKNPEYRQKKEKILELRKQFVMENLNKSLSKSEISRALKFYFENRLDVTPS